MEDFKAKSVNYLTELADMMGYNANDYVEEPDEEAEGLLVEKTKGSKESEIEKISKPKVEMTSEMYMIGLVWSLMFGLCRGGMYSSQKLA